MNKAIKSIILVTALIILVLTIVACGGQNRIEEVGIRGYILVGTVSPIIGNITVLGEYIGFIQPIQQVAVLPRIPGEVQSVYFGVGDWVEVDDILFSVNSTDIQNNITSLEAQLAVQEATVRSAQTGVTLVDGTAMQSQLLTAHGGVSQAEAAIRQAEENIEQALLGIEQAQVAYDMAYQSYSDTKILFEAGVVSRMTFEQAEAGYINAQVTLERAKSGYNLASIGLSQAQNALAQALEGQRILVEDAPGENRRRAQDALAQAQAARDIVIVNLEIARDMLDDTIVRSPISGIVEMRNVEEFSIAAPQSPAFIISVRDSMNVSFRVPRGSAQFLQVGDTISMVDGAFVHEGIITEISTMVDHGGLLTITANIPNPHERLLSGTSVRIFADAQRASDALLLPLTAIHHERGLAHVFVADGSVARRTQVELGIFDAMHAQILSGVDDSDHVIITWSSRLADGIEIEVVQHGGEAR